MYLFGLRSKYGVQGFAQLKLRISWKCSLWTLQWASLLQRAVAAGLDFVVGLKNIPDEAGYPC